MINGKAVLLREEFCNGLGECIPACPHDAIYFFIKEAPPFNEAAAVRHVRMMAPHRPAVQHNAASALPAAKSASAAQGSGRRSTWPIKLSLMPDDAPFLDNADIVLAADCAPVVRSTFSDDFAEGKVVLIACPRLDRYDYAHELKKILKDHSVKSVTLVRMDEAGCSGLEFALTQAVEESGKSIPFEIITLDPSGREKTDVHG